MKTNLIAKAFDWAMNKTAMAANVDAMIHTAYQQGAEIEEMRKALIRFKAELTALKNEYSPENHGQIQGQYTRADKNFVYALGFDNVERVVAELNPQDQPQAPHIKSIVRVGDNYILTTVDNVKFALSA
ncbi:hypothetical protein [Desulfovibrio falkowii]|uniref:hypothetical protein n=1 Tax=Desulfovibrio sp. WGS1351 TaxID=3366814 RepID=UPI00372D73DF